MKHNPLVVETDEPLCSREVESRIVVDDAVVKTQQQTLELGHNAVLVISWIANQSAPDRSGVARQVAHAVIQHITQEKFRSVVVHVGLIVGTSAVDIVKIKSRRPEISEGVWIAMLDQGGHRIKRQIVVHELSEIRVEGGN